MYSPVIDPSLIPVLYHAARSNGIPMTRFVEALLVDALQRCDLPDTAREAFALYQPQKPNPRKEQSMLKVCTSYSKKVPTDQQYSSQQFHASVEVELSDALSPEQLQERIHQTFAVVKSTVENEINGTGAPSNAASPTNGNGNGHGKGKENGAGKASNAQIQFLTSLATEQGIRLSALNEYCQDTHHVESIYELTKKDASALVDLLKRRQFPVAA